MLDTSPGDQTPVRMTAEGRWCAEMEGSGGCMEWSTQGKAVEHRTSTGCMLASSSIQGGVHSYKNLIFIVHCYTEEPYKDKIYYIRTS